MIDTSLFFVFFLSVDGVVDHFLLLARPTQIEKKTTRRELANERTRRDGINKKSQKKKTRRNSSKRERKVCEQKKGEGAGNNDSKEWREKLKERYGGK